MNEKQPWYISSTGQGLSLTVKGVLVGLVPIIIFTFNMIFGIDLTEIELMDIINEVTTVIASAVTVFGLVRKVYLKFVKK